MNRAELKQAVKDRLDETGKALATLDDNTAISVTTLFPRWSPGTAYESGERIRYEEALYRVVQAHTSQVGWEPPAAPALFVKIAKPGEIPVWTQPSGAQDAYAKGDRVHYPDAEGPVYISTVDNNVWQPGVYGWDLD